MENERIIQSRQIKAFIMLAIGLIAGLVMFFVSVVDAFAVPQAASTGWAARRQGGSIQSRVTTVGTRQPRLAFRFDFNMNNPINGQNRFRARSQLLNDAGNTRLTAQPLAVQGGFFRLHQEARGTSSWMTVGTLPTQNRGTGWRACATTANYALVNGSPSNTSPALRALIRFP